MTNEEQLIADRAKTIPAHARKTYLLALSGKSRKAAMQAMCAECVGWERGQVAGCTSVTCPLFPYRRAD